MRCPCSRSSCGECGGRAAPHRSSWARSRIPFRAPRKRTGLRPYITQRLREVLDPEPANIQQVYRDASTAAHREALAAAIPELLQKHGLRLRLSKVLYHHEGGPGKSTLLPRGTPARSRRSTA